MATTTSKGRATKKAKANPKSASTSKKTTVKKTTKKQTEKKKAPANTTTKTAKTTEKIVSKKSGEKKQLRTWNWVLALLAAVQVVALFVLGGKYLYHITTSFTTEDKLSGLPVGASRTLFDINILYVLVGALLTTALLHILLATVLRKKYENELETGVNSTRWIGFSATITIVMLGVSLIVGISDISTLLLISAACVSTGLLAMLGEASVKSRKALDIVGMLASLVPWLIIAVYLIGTNKYGEGGVESSVYYIVASTLALLLLLDQNMRLGNKKSGRWADYLFTDKIYMLINFALCTSLTWQVYFALLK